MTTSSNGNTLHVTGPLCGEFAGHRWIPRTKASDAELWSFFDLRLNKRLSKQSRFWWFETPWRSLWRHCNVLLCFLLFKFTIMIRYQCGRILDAILTRYFKYWRRMRIYTYIPILYYVKWMSRMEFSHKDDRYFTLHRLYHYQLWGPGDAPGHHWAFLTKTPFPT